MRIQILILGFKGLTPGTYIIHSQVQIREKIFSKDANFSFFFPWTGPETKARLNRRYCRAEVNWSKKIRL